MNLLTSLKLDSLQCDWLTSARDRLSSGKQQDKRWNKCVDQQIVSCKPGALTQVMNISIHWVGESGR